MLSGYNLFMRLFLTFFIYLTENCLFSNSLQKKSAKKQETK